MIDLVMYRAKIGAFALACKPRLKLHKYDTYRSHYNGSDIHFRMFICNLVVLMIMSATYGLLASHAYLVENYAALSSDQCEGSIVLASINIQQTHHIASVNYGGLYRSYVQRLLVLSADVESNPGPGPGHGIPD